MTTLATRLDPVDGGNDASLEVEVPVAQDARRSGTFRVVAWLCARALARPLLMQG